jgi:hypothetical protein
MKDTRAAATLLLLVLTFALAGAVPVANYVVASRGSDELAPDLWNLVLAPLVPGLVAVLLSRSRLWTLGVVFVLVVLTAYATFFGATIGEQQAEHRAEREAEARRYDEWCNTASTGMSVPFRVDHAFHDVGRVEDHHLHGPLAGGSDGCTMEVAGDVEDSFAAWRAQLVGSGWRVDRDDSEVVVTRRGVQLTLFVRAGRTYLTTSTIGADDCRTGRSAVGEEPAPPSDSEVALASPPCS